MNNTYNLDDIAWQQLTQQIGEQFSDLTLKRGFQYFRQHRVHQLTTPDAHHIEAMVQGTEDYHVTFNLESFSSSHCQCPVPSHCKHMVAVLLEYADQQGRSVHAIVNASSHVDFKTPSKTPPEAGRPRAGLQTFEQKEKALAQIQQDALQLSTLPISAWHDLFARLVTLNGVNSQNTHYVQNILSSLYALQPVLTPALSLWFELHVQLYVLRTLIKPQSSGLTPPSNYHMGYYTQIAAEDLQKSMRQLFTRDPELADSDDSWQSVSETLNILRQYMLTEPPNISYFSEIYDLLWMNWIRPSRTDDQIILDELVQLQSAEEEIGPALARKPWAIAQSRMYFYLAQDDQAKHWLRAAKLVAPAMMLRYLEILQNEQNWDRLKDWLLHVGPDLNSHRSDHMTEYMSYWQTELDHHPEAEPHMWNMLVQMLPQSRKIYEDTLLAHERWQEWIDYQLTTGQEPLHFRVSVLQPIEKNAPELLLPFYHQAVERYIILKNRSSYKSAVKLLKRLAKLYKKMKREERWEQFLDAFVRRHSRLRALQEELRKGKLIS
ncbi:hypothetical protein J2Z69_001790 [Paenibacillus shirakamiensis]|uniref:SWIM-type domain-containing protein n=1 Tax=Paenibacillus shirakamiensis TaxID=1265935 RepID=A0ABS4JJG8_9BACL|nr:hypothetical protein [Paenibacillus shirakamiensis]MBP2000759.1 hypothetical protein [Paenibacillus shirakamiensis]